MPVQLVQALEFVKSVRETLPFGGWELVAIGVFFFYKSIFRLVRSAIFILLIVGLIGGLLFKNTDLFDTAKNQLLDFVKGQAKKHLSQVQEDASSEDIFSIEKS